MSDRPKALAPVNRKLPIYEPAQRGASLCLHRWKVHRIGGKKVRICSLCSMPEPDLRPG